MKKKGISGRIWAKFENGFGIKRQKSRTIKENNYDTMQKKIPCQSFKKLGEKYSQHVRDRIDISIS